MNLFLEDDEELKKNKDKGLDDDDKKKKKDDDDDDSSDDSNDYLDDYDSDDDDDSDDYEDNDSDSDDEDYSGNDYIDDEGDSSDSDDDFEDDSNSDYDGGNDYLGDAEEGDYQSSGEGSGNKLAKLAYAVVVATNNFHHIHLMCAGKKFDNIHRVTDELKSEIGYWVDTIAEMALEDEECEMDNFCNSAKYVSEMGLESEKTYDYESGCTAISETLRKLIEIMTETRNSIDKPHVQSRLDDYLVTLNKNYNFLMKRRMKNVDESVSYNNFI